MASTGELGDSFYDGHAMLHEANRELAIATLSTELQFPDHKRKPLPRAVALLLSGDVSGIERAVDIAEQVSDVVRTVAVVYRKTAP